MRTYSIRGKHCPRALLTTHERSLPLLPPPPLLQSHRLPLLPAVLVVLASLWANAAAAKSDVEAAREQADKVKGLEGGANDYLTKPYDNKELILRVRNTLEWSRSQRQANPLTGLPGNQAIEAPAIAGLPAWYIEAQVRNFRGGVRGAHPDDYAGLRMRPMGRMMHDDQKLVNVTHYAATLDPVEPAATLEGDVARGKVHYDQVCVACHGADGRGNEALHAPPLLNNSDWYMVSQLKKFKSGLRGAKPEDTWGATMRSMSMTLEDEQHMRDVVAYVLTLRE